MRQQVQWKITALLKLHRSSEVLALVQGRSWLGGDFRPLYINTRDATDFVSQVLDQDVDHGIFLALEAKMLS